MYDEKTHDLLGGNIINMFARALRHHIQHYNPDKYWRYQMFLSDPQNKTKKWEKILMLMYVKKCDTHGNSSFGTYLGKGARFKSQPFLVHGLNGIIFGCDVIAGSKLIICHQVTVQAGGVVIGDNVFIGSGAKILAGVRIGNNVRIGANAVVVEDVPDNATVVLPKSRILIKSPEDEIRRKW